MDFELSEDQVALADGVRSFCDGRFPMATVRALADGHGLDRDRWRELGDLGLFSLRLPEAEGGAEMGWADAVVAFEELGRALVPGPLVWTQLLAGTVPGAATGEAVVTGMDRSDPSGLVEFPDRLDHLAVVDDAGIWLVAADELALEPLHALDPLTPVARLTAPLPQGELILDPEAAARLRICGAALTSALLLGAAQASAALAVAYAKERQQFARPIGAFQAMKHLLADTFTRAEVARGAVYAAGVTLDDPAVGSVERAVAAAKLTAAEAALGNAKTCIQVHGGMGFTWEIDAHLFLKRAYALEPAFGTRDDWADTMADLLDRTA
jgi:alkylation response protein AidB-like acyl-CoA dehydrogenase